MITKDTPEMAGWDALTEDITYRLDEARKQKQQLSGLNRAGRAGAFYNGEIAALEYLLKRDAERRAWCPRINRDRRAEGSDE